jgi:hypothetical protein
METINDIVCEMRKDIPRVVDTKVILRNYADRLEAATKHQFREVTKTILHEEVGVRDAANSELLNSIKSYQINSSKAREALENARSLIYEGIETEVKDDIEHPFHLELALEKIDEALAEPLRNCDVGTADEQAERFKAFCNSHPLMCDGCPFRDIGILHNDCAIHWSQMPYEEVK